MRPGELAEIHGGQSAMKGALDIGDKEAVRVLAKGEDVGGAQPLLLL